MLLKDRPGLSGMMELTLKLHLWRSPPIKKVYAESGIFYVVQISSPVLFPYHSEPPVYHKFISAFVDISYIIEAKRILVYFKVSFQVNPVNPVTAQCHTLPPPLPYKNFPPKRKGSSQKKQIFSNLLHLPPLLLHPQDYFVY